MNILTDKMKLADHTGVIVITSELEVGLGMIACSLPPLRKLLTSFVSTTRSRLGGSGHLGSGPQFASSTSGTSKFFGGGVGGRRGSTELTSLSSPGPVLHHHGAKKDWCRLDDESSQGTAPASAASQRPVIIRETTVAIQHTPADRSQDAPKTFW